MYNENMIKLFTEWFVGSIRFDDIKQERMKQ